MGFKKLLKCINFGGNVQYMKSFVLIIVCVLLGVPCFAKKAPKPVVSTQGIEISQDVANSQMTKSEKNEQKALQSRSKKYIKNNKNLKKQNLKKQKQERELEYLKSRLEVKRNKLETRFPDYVKGESK